MGNLKIKKFYDKILISNSPISQANGIYTLSSVRVNGLRYYEQQAGSWRIAAGKESVNEPFTWSIFINGISTFYYSTNSSFNSIFDLPEYPWECSGWVDGNNNPINIKLEPYSTITKNSISIKKQNLSTLIPFQIGINLYPNNLYTFKSATTNLLGTVFNPILFNAPYGDIINITPPNQGQLIFYFDGSTWVYSYDFITNANNYVIPNNSIIQIQTDNITSVPVGGGAIIQKLNNGKLNLNSSNIPLNTLNIRVTNGPSNAPWGVGGSGPCGNDFQLTTNPNGNYWKQGHLGCDFFIAWDNKYGTLPYKWRLYYDSDGRLDYAEHPTATQEALPSKGWSNGMTISIV